jgi:hypothetical protein
MDVGLKQRKKGGRSPEAATTTNERRGEEAFA